MAINDKPRSIPYMGNKEKIAKQIIDILPTAHTFVDLFCGGCSMTVQAILSGKYKEFIINDKEQGLPQFFIDTINGKYQHEERWISREDFLKLKDTDLYVRYLWSFGNNTKHYMYAREIEPLKRAIHYAIFFNDRTPFHNMGIYIPTLSEDKATRKKELEKWIKDNETECREQYTEWYMKTTFGEDGKFQIMCNSFEEDISNEKERLRQMLVKALQESGLTQTAVNKHLNTQMGGHYFGSSQWQFPDQEAYTKLQEILPLPQPYEVVTKYKTMLQSLQRLQRLQRLQSLESLERLERLQRLQRLQKTLPIHVYNTDYDKVQLPHNAVIYCDPPYQGTTEYRVKFDYDKFRQWCRDNKQHRIFVSEYNMPTDFTTIATFKKRSLMSGKGSGKIMNENLYTYGQDNDNLFTPQHTQLRLQF